MFLKIKLLNLIWYDDGYKTFLTRRFSKYTTPLLPIASNWKIPRKIEILHLVMHLHNVKLSSEIFQPPPPHTHTNQEFPCTKNHYPILKIFNTQKLYPVFALRIFFKSRKNDWREYILRSNTIDPFLQILLWHAKKKTGYTGFF